MNKQPANSIQAIPDKGQSIIATRSIEKGELIISEKALFTQGRIRNRESIFSALSDLPAEAKREYLSLANCHDKSRVHPFVGIFDTNAYPCGANQTGSNIFTGDEATTAGIFLRCSRLNSSCTPNVNNYWSTKREMLEIRAMRDIASGEELCTCYSGEWLPRDERRAKLDTNFGFSCRCATCSLEGAAQIASDRRRSQIRRLYDEIVKCARTPDVGVRKAKEAIRLCREEGLVHGKDTFAYDAFQFCVSVSNRAVAKKWIERAREVKCMIMGNDCESASTYARYIKQVEGSARAATVHSSALAPVFLGCTGLDKYSGQ